MTGIELIAQERDRQMRVEGWTQEHDDSHEWDQMIFAAIVYAYAGTQHGVSSDTLQHTWPWEPEWFKPTTRKRNLMKAGALIAAELDRLIRCEERESNTDQRTESTPSTEGSGKSQ